MWWKFILILIPLIGIISFYYVEFLRSFIIWRKWSLIFVSLIATASFYYVDFVKNYGGKEHLSQVVGIPTHDNVLPQPYTGPHPSKIKRPQDSFNYPIKIGEIGPVEPLFTKPLIYPFLCNTEESGLGQPLVDNHEQIGIPVYAEDEHGSKTETIVGYSKDCLIPNQARYYYNRQGTEKFYPLEHAKNDIAKIAVKGDEIDFIVRLEVGTINRFIYGIAVLKGLNETLDNPDSHYWNKRLIYKFRGGVGVGKRQGRFEAEHVYSRLFDQLRQGYAVVYSTGNRTSNHYNIWLSEDTALRVKRQFIALYGKPLYTVGFGGSGGAIQQYLIGQNNPDVIDVAMPTYSYPDMVTQTIYGLDCELIEYFFEATDAENEKWHNWDNRHWVEGLNTRSNVGFKFWYLYALAKLFKGQWPFPLSGSSECMSGWKGLTPLIHNPNFIHFYRRFTNEVAKQTHWSYWDDMKYFYGVNQFGYAQSTYDNVGVQYGLKALRDGNISPEEFLKLNANIGGWKHPQDMQQERFWFAVGDLDPRISAWSEHNMLQDVQIPVPRTKGDSKAIEAAYRSGNVFLGRIQIPIVDMRHYLEPQLNMHHISASFAIRQRMIREQGHADNQLIWITKQPHDPFEEAFDLIDRWMLNILNNPDKGVVANKPKDAVDKCFTGDKRIIAEGDRVWDGEWNKQPTGLCMRVYPQFSNSRMVAGDDIAGDIFKCQLQSVDEAIAKGMYSGVDMRLHLKRLQVIFPDGVCDYTKLSVGRPKNLLK